MATPTRKRQGARSAVAVTRGSGNVFADIAKRNMAMFEEAGKAFAAAAPAAKAAAEKDTSSEVDKLRAELAALQAKVDKLGK